MNQILRKNLDWSHGWKSQNFTKKIVKIKFLFNFQNFDTIMFAKPLATEIKILLKIWGGGVDGLCKFDIPWGISNFYHTKYWPCFNINRAGERHSLRDFKYLPCQNGCKKTQPNAAENTQSTEGKENSTEDKLVSYSWLKFTCQ